MASPNSTLPRTPEEQDSRYNPAEQAYQEKMGAGYVSSGTDQLESFANDPNNASKEAQEAEDADYSGQNGLYRPTGGRKRKEKFSFKGFVKKKGALISIIGLLLGGGGAFSIMLAPGLGLVQLKEVLVGDLNDQLSAVDIRTNALWKAKLGTLQGAGVCSNQVKIKCQFKTMSKRQVERFRKAGFTNLEVQDGIAGRQRITNMTAPNGAVISDPQDLINSRRDPQVRSAMNRVFNPLYASLSDSTAMKVITEKIKSSKASKLTGTTVEELDQSLADNTTGERPRNASIVQLDEDGKRFVADTNGNPVYESDSPDRFKEITDKAAAFDEKLSDVGPGPKAFNSVVSGAAKGASVLGAVDAACSVYNLTRAVAAAAKAARAVELAQYSMVFLTTADEIKAGTATPEQTDYFGKTVTATDTRKTITDELSTSSDTNFANAQPRDNPMYGKNGFDSNGYAIAAYNDAPTLSSQSQQFMIGGGMSGTLSDVSNQATSLIGGDEAAARTCGVIQSWWVRGAGLAVGVIAAIGSFGASTVISLTASIAVSAAMPLLEAMLVDIMKGQVTKDLEGPDAVDAMFAGTSEVLGQTAQARGLVPQNSAGLEEYLTQSMETKNEYIAQASFEAKAVPFDIYNQYSFLGSFARSINIPLTKASSSITGLFTSIPQFFSASALSLIPKASAQTAYNPERFNKCDDIAYKNIGISADVFCNVRFGLSTTDLNRDPIEVVDYMVNNEHISASGAAKSTPYTDYLKYCVNRVNGWGETGGEENGNFDLTSGKACMGGTGTFSDEDLGNFRVYTLDKTVSDAMDDEEVNNSAVDNVDGLVAPLVDGFRLSDGFGPRSCSGCSSWHQGLDMVNGDRTVRSVMSGTVLSVDSGGNNTVRIQHADGLISVFLHMYREDITVNAGDTVTAGQQIGLIGNAGQSQGAHLHFEFDISEVQDRALYEQKYVVNTGGFNPGNRIDPADYFQKNGIPGF